MSPATKKWCQVIRSAAPVTQNHLSKPEDLMLQHATPLRKSAAWPTNISDENLSCNAPATRNPFLQILFKCPTPAIVFGHATKTVTFCSLFARCRIPCTCHTKRRFKIQKWREHGVLCTFWIGIVLRATTACTFSSSQLPKVLENDVRFTFWLGDVLRATRACTFSTSQLPKVLRTWQLLTLLTSKCASCHNCVHFFDITTSKSTHFDLETCFAPQRRALFHHLNFQKCSENGVLCTFWLGNVLRTTRVCNFSASQLPKVLREWCALYILTWKCASRHKGVHFFSISTSKSALRMMCFVHFDLEVCFAPHLRAFVSSLIWPHGSAPAALASLLFDPPEPQISLEKHNVSRLSYLFAHLHLLSSHSFSSLIFSLLLFSSLTLPTSAFPSVHIVGSLTSKLPSTRCYQSVWKEHFAAQNLGNPKLVPFCLPPSSKSNSSAYLNGAAFKLRKFTTPCRASEDFVTWSRLSVPYSSMSNLHKQARGRSDQWGKEMWRNQANQAVNRDLPFG